MDSSPEVCERLGRLYQSWLVLYPARHRERFGAAMEQLFRDQCRNARSTGGRLRLAAFLVRAIVDLLVSAGRERADQCRRFLAMHPQLNHLLRASLFGGLAFTVVLTAAVALTLSQTPVYMSYARVIVDPPGAATGLAQADPIFLQTESERLKSAEVLQRVVQELDLVARWKPRFSGDDRWDSAAAVQQLRNSLEVRQYRNTTILEVRTYEPDRTLAANIANGIVSARLESTAAPPGGPTLRLVDPAEPGLKPVRPNIPLCFALGILAAGMLGLMTAGTVWLTRLVRSTATRPA